MRARLRLSATRRSWDDGPGKRLKREETVYGWGVRVRRPVGARGMSSVRYETRLGDLKENWFLLFSNGTLNTQFGKTGLQGLPTRMTLFLWADKGLLGSPYSQHGIL